MKKLICLIIPILFACAREDTSNPNDWRYYLGDKTSSQYSSLDQINIENVAQLKVAWTYSSNDKDANDRSQIQCNPLVVDGILYGTSPQHKLFALRADTGKEIWVFDPFNNTSGGFARGVNRGLVYFEDNEKKRIFYSGGHHLFSVNVVDGNLDTGFGEKGKVDLKKGLGRDVEDLYLTSNTPGIIYKDLLIMGQRVSESDGAAPGHIRAYNVHSGEQVWMFKTVPHPGEYGYETWPEDAYKRIGGANAWAGFSLDEKRGIVYCPTGSAAFDFYGGDRHGANLFANCVLALDAGTGEYIWHYQTIHHDVWDKDVPAPPNLMTIKHNGRNRDVVAQITKNALLYVLDRETGKPLYPVEEIDVPQSDLRGEQTWRTQPIPTGFPKYARFELTVDDLADRNEDAANFAKAVWNESKSYHIFAPPSTEGGIVFPGFDGGGEWGGAAFDPESGCMIINSSEMPWRIKMIEVKPVTKGEGVYTTFCQQCHGAKFEGGDLFGNVPSLTDLGNRLTLEDVKEVINNGKGVMPSFAYINDEQIEAVYNYILGLEGTKEKEMDESWPYPYKFRGYERLYAPDGFPIIKPPWGQLTAVDMNKRGIVWQVPLGEHKKLTELGMPITGTENYGGPVVTAGGLVFIASTLDERIRAFDKNTGEELWTADLPAAGYATPAVYAVNGKQYVVIACGGGKLNTKSGDSYVAFSL